MAKKKGAPNEVQFKRIRIDMKSLVESKDDGEAEFDAYASVFGNIDSFGDVIHKGAFARSLKEWKAKDAPIPLYYNHSLFGSDPTDNIGYLKIAQEDDTGLKVTPVLDIGANQKSSYVHHLLKSGRVRELSIGYVPKTYDYSEVDGVEVRNLRDVELLEVSVVPVAANDKATVVEVRSALQYGPSDESKADGDDDADTDDDATEDTDTEAGDALTPEAVQKLADVVTAAGEQITAAMTALSDALAETLGDEDDSSDDDEAADDDSSGDTAGAKSGRLSAQTRAALAMMALHGAEKEIAR